MIHSGVNSEEYRSGYDQIDWSKSRDRPSEPLPKVCEMCRGAKQTMNGDPCERCGGHGTEVAAKIMARCTHPHTIRSVVSNSRFCPDCQRTISDAEVKGKQRR